MIKNVPLEAQKLLELIRDTEVGTAGRAGYDVIFGHNQNKLSKPLTSMTLAEVQAAQPGWSKRFRSSAAGAYQFMRATLKGLIEELKLPGDLKFDPLLQDQLAYHLLLRRGFERFMSKQIDRTQFGRALAQEWASFPVLASTRGSRRIVKRGETYYAGDKLNKALIPPERVEEVLDQLLTKPKDDGIKVDEIQAAPAHTGLITLLAMIASAVAAFFGWGD